MEVTLTLALPRDSYSVPVARRVLAGALRLLGVADHAISDIELALTEAVTNVLDHADATDSYEVSAGIRGTLCVIDVVDRGHGFDGSAHGLRDAGSAQESGRGVQIMRALVDRVTFTSRPQEGMVVHLEKQLDFEDGSLLRLSETGAAGLLQADDERRRDDRRAGSDEP
jgi:serine/threonine-protein kinase RsbW